MRTAMVIACVFLLQACGADRTDQGAVNFGALRLGSVLQGDVTGFARAQAPRTFQFPLDHGAHPSFRSEWWYLTANLQSTSGEHYGMQFTVFRQALSPQQGGERNPWRSNQMYLAHFAISDVSAKEHYHGERFSRSHPALAGVAEQPPKVFVGDWALEFQGEELALQASNGELSASLSLKPERPILLQGDKGLSHKSAGNASYYYSYPRLRVSGQIQVGDKSEPVTGLAWFDHEWSTSVLSDQQTGWDWFALHLRDGRDIMVFRLRRGDGQRDPYDHGAYVTADSANRYLGVDDYSLTVTRSWTDPEGVAWPVGWSLDLGGERMHISAAFDDQRMQTLLSYWEGVVVISNNEGQVIGDGYMELTGYE